MPSGGPIRRNSDPYENRPTARLIRTISRAVASRISREVRAVAGMEDPESVQALDDICLNAADSYTEGVITTANTAGNFLSSTPGQVTVAVLVIGRTAFLATQAVTPVGMLGLVAGSLLTGFATSMTNIALAPVGTAVFRGLARFSPY
jgi:hypothetical protein